MTCRIGSVPSPHIKWVWEGSELQNSSVREARSGRRYMIVTSEESEVTTSRLILTQVSGEQNIFLSNVRIEDLDSRAA